MGRRTPTINPNTNLRIHCDNNIMKDEMGGGVERMAEMRNPYKSLVGRPKGNRPLRKPKCR
jgi:hypothetical protein